MQPRIHASQGNPHPALCGRPALTHLFTALLQPVNGPRTLLLHTSRGHGMSDQHLAPARMQPVGTVRQQQYHQQCSASWMRETHLIVVCLGQAGLHRTRRSVAGIGRHAQHRHPSGGGGSGGGGKAQPVLRRCWPLRGLGIGLRVVLWLPAPEQVAPWARAPEGAREQTQERLAAILSRCAPRSEATEVRGWLIKRPGAHRI